MARTTAAEVKKILDPNVSVTDINADAFINDANNLVTEILGDDTSITTALKTSIEKWLAAHMIASTVEPMVAKGKGGPAEVTYTGKWGMGFESTSYGQTAMALDTTGKLRSMSTGKAARVWTVGS